MNLSEAHDLARDLVARALGHDEGDPSSGADLLATLDGRDWLLLDEAARAYRIDGSPASGVRGWLGESLTEASGFVAAMTSLHVDGRTRERATRVLGTLDTDVATRALAVRLLDHVPEVREQARSALATRTSIRAVQLVLDVVLAGRDRSHAAAALDHVHSALYRVSGREDDALRALRSSDSRRVRRWAFERAHDRALLSEDMLVAAAVGDDDQWVQARCASWLMRTSSPEALLPLLRATSVEARLVALTRLPADLIDEPALVRALTDKSPRVREQARWRSRRLGLDHLSLYRELASSSTAVPRQRAAALEALGLIGDESDGPTVRAALGDRSPRVRAAAVAAAAGRFDPATAVELLAPLLDDPSGRVSSAVATHLTRVGATPDPAAEVAWRSERPASRRAAWRLARSAGGWHRVEADLRASTDSDDDLASLGRAAIRNWLVVGAATTYGVPGPGQRERLAAQLSSSGLSAEVSDVIAFHARIGRESAVPGSDAPVGQTDHEPSARRRPWWRWLR